MPNAGVFSNTPDSFKGVNYRPGRRKWVAQISYKGRYIYLGGFTLEEDAARAYDRAAKMLYGDQAVLNFPGE